MEAEKLSESVVTLLIVDDEPLMTELFHKAMTKRGFRVLKAAGGAEALAIVPTETVDMVITDLSMPVMDGTALAHALYALAPLLPVLIATGHDVDATQLDLPHNVIGIIRKPYQHKVLEEQIHDILAPDI